MSSSSSSESEDEGFGRNRNEDWLDTALSTSGHRQTISRRQTKQDERLKKEQENEKLRQSREWKPKSQTNPTVASNSGSSLNSTSDFGVSWLQKALDRIYQQSKEQKVPPEVLASERWGSLEKLKQMLQEAKDKMKQQNRPEKVETKRRREDRPRIDDRKESRHSASYHPSNSNEVKNLERGQSSVFQKQHSTSSETIVKLALPNIETIPTTSTSEYHKPLTESEKNSIHAKILKAEMLGNTTLVKELKRKLEMDRSTETTTVDTKVVKVYQKFNEDEMTLKELFMREKTLNAGEDGKMFAKSSLRSINPHKFNPDDEYDNDPKNKKRKTDQLLREEEKTDDECRNCYSKYNKRLVLAFGRHVFLCLGNDEALVDGHLIIRSMTHSSNNFVSADEDMQQEVERLKQAVVEMNKSLSKTVIFTEIYRKSSKKYDNHMIIECIPIPEESTTEARLYFKKALLECETEWSMNKKLVELSGKSIQRMVPKGLPYFWVTFGSANEGYAHVIEDEEQFQSNFSHEVVGGLLDLEPRKWRKPKRASNEQLNEQMSQVKKQWIPFNPFRTTNSS